MAFNSNLNDLFSNFKNQQNLKNYSAALKSANTNNVDVAGTYDSAFLLANEKSLLKEDAIFDFNNDGMMDYKDMVVLSNGIDIDDNGIVDDMEKEFVLNFKSKIKTTLINNLSKDSTLTIKDLMDFENAVATMSKEDKTFWKSEISSIESKMKLVVKSNFSKQKDINGDKALDLTDLKDFWQQTYNAKDLNNSSLLTWLGSFESALTSELVNNGVATADAIAEMKSAAMKELVENGGVYTSEIDKIVIPMPEPIPYIKPGAKGSKEYIAKIFNDVASAIGQEKINLDEWTPIMDVKTGRVVSLTKKSDSGIYYLGKKYDITYVGDNVEISVGMQGGAGYGTTTYTFVNEVLKKSYFVNASLGPSGNAVLTEYNKDASKKKVTYYNSAGKTIVATTDFTKTSDGKLVETTSGLDKYGKETYGVKIETTPLAKGEVQITLDVPFGITNISSEGCNVILGNANLRIGINDAATMSVKGNLPTGLVINRADGTVEKYDGNGNRILDPVVVQTFEKITTPDGKVHQIESESWNKLSDEGKAKVKKVLEQDYPDIYDSGFYMASVVEEEYGSLTFTNMLDPNVNIMRIPEAEVVNKVTVNFSFDNSEITGRNVYAYKNNVDITKTYSADNVLLMQTEVSMNEIGKKEVNKYFDGKGKLESFYEYQYNENNRIVAEFESYNYGNNTCSAEYSYNGDLVVSGSRKYTKGGVTTSLTKWGFEYDKNNQMIASKYTDFDGNGNVISVSKDNWVYNENGDCLTYHNVQLNGKNEKTYEYYTQNTYDEGMMSSTSYWVKDEDGKRSGETSYYKNGNMKSVSSEEIDTAGVKVFSEKSEFNDDGSLIVTEGFTLVKPDETRYLQNINLTNKGGNIYQKAEYIIDSNGQMTVTADNLEIESADWLISIDYKENTPVLNNLTTLGENDGTAKADENLVLYPDTKNYIILPPYRRYGSFNNITINGNKNVIKGGLGNDDVVVNGNSNEISLDFGDDNLTVNGSNNYVDMSDGRDKAEINGNSNTVKMGSGDDYVIANGDKNFVDLGSGKDYLGWTGSQPDIVVDKYDVVEDLNKPVSDLSALSALLDAIDTNDDGKLGVKEFLEALTNAGVADMDGNANAISVQETALLQYLVGLNNNKALIKDIINGNFDNIDADTMEDLVELNEVLVSMKPQKPVITPGKRGSIEWIQNIMGLKIVIDDNSKEYYPDGRIMKFREGGMGFSFPTYNISYDDKEGTTKVFVSPDVEGNGIYKSYLYDADGNLINYAEYRRFKDLTGGDYYIDTSKLNDAYESYEYDYSQQGFDNVPQFDKDGNRVPDGSGYKDPFQYDQDGNRIARYQFDEYGNLI